VGEYGGEGGFCGRGFLSSVEATTANGKLVLYTHFADFPLNNPTVPECYMKNLQKTSLKKKYL
jgi:hypothetical protein